MVNKKLNSTDIAKLAGVSRSTVSRVINGYSNVPKETREKVMQVIEENDYYPLLSGQLLVGKKTKTLGFIWVSGTGGSIAKSIQCTAFLAHVTENAAKQGYLVLTCLVENLTEQKNIDWVKRIFMQERVDAGIFLGVDNEEPLVEELIAKGNIVAVFDHFHYDKNEGNRISVNFETDTGEKVINYLYDLGHREIAVIDGNMNRFSCANRHISFLKAMHTHQLLIRPEWMHFAELTEEGGYCATKQLLALSKELPTAICATNDAVAFGVYKALNEAGIKIPEDISVVGIDGHENVYYVTPSLTTFSFNFADVFHSLVSRTIAVVEEEENIPLTEFLASTLVEGGSCRNLNNKTSL